ncbi:RNA polymerase sigma factor [Bacillaceae bacterium Marseille-Q3522]|nr:RNA polymerase sigma factor [Bacillaceae bacterium Marseille-Q3522]
MKRSEVFFEEAVNEYGRIIYKYIYSLVRHKELAEDLYQEVLLAAYIHLDNFQARANIKNWLLKIALNKCRDHWRKQGKEKRFWEEQVYLLAPDMKADPLPEEMVVSKCRQEEITGSLQELPEIYRDPLLLFYYDNRSLLEISQSKNVPLSTIKTRMKRAKERLRPKMSLAGI